MKNLPEKIYLQIGGSTWDEGINDFNGLAEVTWCKDKINDDDIEYVLPSQFQHSRPTRRQIVSVLYKHGLPHLSAHAITDELLSLYGDEKTEHPDKVTDEEIEKWAKDRNKIWSGDTELTEYEITERIIGGIEGAQAMRDNQIKSK